MSGERCALNRRNPDLLEIAQAGVEFDCDRISHQRGSGRHRVYLRPCGDKGAPAADKRIAPARRPSWGCGVVSYAGRDPATPSAIVPNTAYSHHGNGLSRTDIRPAISVPPIVSPRSQRPNRPRTLIAGPHRYRRHFSNEQPYFGGQGSRQCDAVVAVRGPPQKSSPRLGAGAAVGVLSEIAAMESRRSQTSRTRGRSCGAACRFVAGERSALVSDGEDLRRLPLSMRKVSLARLLARRVDGIFLTTSSGARSDPTCSATPADGAGDGVEASREHLSRRPVPALVILGAYGEPHHIAGLAIGGGPDSDPWPQYQPVLKVKNWQHPAFSRVQDQF